MNLKSNPFIAWILRHWSTLLVAFILIGVFFYRYSFVKKKSDQDLLLQESIYSKWEQNPTNEEYFQELKALLQRNHDLHHSYDGLIAQKLLEMKKIEELPSFSKLPVEKLHKISADYAEFVKISLLITQEKWQEALVKAYDLNERLDEISYLKFCNLLRISLLEKSLNHSNRELKALAQLESMLAKKSSLLKESSLKDYIFQRKAHLSQ